MGCSFDCSTLPHGHSLKNREMRANWSDVSFLLWRRTEQLVYVSLKKRQQRGQRDVELECHCFTFWSISSYLNPIGEPAIIFATSPRAANHKQSNAGTSDRLLDDQNQWRLSWSNGETDWIGWRVEGKRWLCKRDANKLFKNDFPPRPYVVLVQLPSCISLARSSV